MQGVYNVSSNFRIFWMEGNWVVEASWLDRRDYGLWNPACLQCEQVVIIVIIMIIIVIVIKTIKKFKN